MLKFVSSSSNALAGDSKYYLSPQNERGKKNQDRKSQTVFLTNTGELLPLRLQLTLEFLVSPNQS